MTRKNERAVARVVIATGVGSVTTQLFVIREFMAQFQGNEFVIALILFSWLILGGIGTLLARIFTKRFRPATAVRLAWFSFCLSALPPLQILSIRWLRDFFFIHGSSVGFYPILSYTFLTLAPYGLLVGFVLPFSLFVLKAEDPDYPGARIYIMDNIGDVVGGALFSFVLVYFLTPLKAVGIANLPLVVSSFLLFPPDLRRRWVVFIGSGLAVFILLGGIGLESLSLMPSEGKLVYYRESRYGRIIVVKDREQFTLFQDGVPVYSSQNLSIAEETIHYPLSQLPDPKRVLLISAEGGMLEELKKHRVESVDYVEIDPEVTSVQFRFGLIGSIPGLNVIHKDGRAYLSRTDKIYDAIIVNLPEPGTFQVNRFFTDRFFKSAKAHLTAEGVLSFSMEGFENYLAEPERQKLSCLYNTVSEYFKHVLLLPGQKTFFLCRDLPIHTDIPEHLAKKGVLTEYIKGFYFGNLTDERIERLNRLMDPSTAKNRDEFPYLMRLMFSQWFARFSTSPTAFFIVLSVCCIIYWLRITKEEFVLFSTGCMTMGSELLVIFAFQILFGYIYLQIGLIVTVFLAGLLPGAWLGNRLRNQGKAVLLVTDGILVFLLMIFMMIFKFEGRVPSAAFLTFGFAVALTCGAQFPAALHLGGGDNPAATRAFSADLIGAACGALVTSVVLIPLFGMIWAAFGLIGLKLFSLILSFRISRLSGAYS